MKTSDDIPVRGSWRSAVRGNVLMMGLVSLFTDFSSEMMNPLLPMFVVGLVGSDRLGVVYVGLMEGIAETTAAILKIFSGRISDRLGKRKGLVILGYGLSAAARPLMAMAGLWAASLGGVQVIALKFFDRIGKGIRTSPRDALIGDSVDSSVRGMAFSFHRAMDHAGAVLGPLTAMAILFFVFHQFRWGPDPSAGSSTSGRIPSAGEVHAMRWLFAVALLPGLAAMLALVLKVREIAPQRAAKGPAGGIASDGARRRLPARFYAFVAIVTLFALGNSSDLFLVYYAYTLFHFGLAQVILLWIVLHLSKIFFSFPGGWLSDRLGRRPVIVTGWIVYALVYLGMAFIDPRQPWQFWGLFIAYGMYYGMTEGVEKALVADFVPSENRGTAFGIYHGAVGFAALPASAAFGCIWNMFGHQLAFGLGAALAGAAAAGLILLLSAARK